MVKVYARYADGEFTLITVADDASGPDIFEMPQDKWDAYKAHMQECRAWHEYIGKASGRYR